MSEENKKAARELRTFRTCEPYDGIRECIDIAKRDDVDISLEINAVGFPGIVMFLGPKDVFEARYASYQEAISGLREKEKSDKNMSYKDRVALEKKELDEKLVKLSIFLDTETFAALPLAEKYRLTRQSIVMREYSRILGERLEWMQKELK